MATYLTNNTLGGSQQNMGTSFKTIVSMFAGSTTRRGYLYEFNVGADTAPANNTLIWDVSRMTADGTGTAVTPLPAESADAACLATSKANYTAEPTVTAATNLKSFPLNQQATFRWISAAGGALAWPATANNGLVIRAKGLTSGYASTVLADAAFEE